MKGIITQTCYRRIETCSDVTGGQWIILLYYHLFIPVNEVSGRQIVFSVAMMVEGRQRWEEDKKTVMEGKMETQDWRLSSSVWQ